MIVDRKRYSNRYDVSCETVGGPLLRLAYGGFDETFAAQAVSTLPATMVSSGQGCGRPSRGPRRRHSAAPRSPKEAIVRRDRVCAGLCGLHDRGDGGDRVAERDCRDSRRRRRPSMPISGCRSIFAALRSTASARRLDQQSEESPELLVTGEIVNLRDSETPVPDLRLALRAENGRELYVWTARGPKNRLGPHERVAFRSRLAAPSPGVRDVLVKFAAPGDKASFTE